MTVETAREAKRLVEDLDVLKYQPDKITRLYKEILAAENPEEPALKLAEIAHELCRRVIDNTENDIRNLKDKER